MKESTHQRYSEAHSLQNEVSIPDGIAEGDLFSPFLSFHGLVSLRTVHLYIIKIEFSMY